MPTSPMTAPSTRMMTRSCGVMTTSIRFDENNGPAPKNGMKTRYDVTLEMIDGMTAFASKSFM